MNMTCVAASPAAAPSAANLAAVSQPIGDWFPTFSQIFDHALAELSSEIPVPVV